MRGSFGRVTSVAVGVLLAVASVGVATAQIADSSVSINIVDAPREQAKWGYAPRTSTIVPGTWVTWSNAGQDAHTVTAVDGSFDSGNLDPSEGFSWFFDQPGTFPYTCSLHEWMTGTIVVSGASNQPSAVSDQQPLSDPTPQDKSVVP